MHPSLPNRNPAQLWLNNLTAFLQIKYIFMTGRSETEVMLRLKLSTGRPCIPAFLVLYSILSAIYLLFDATLQGRPVCACVFRNNACIRKNASCSESRMYYSCVQLPVTVEVNTACVQARRVERKHSGLLECAG